MHSPTKYPHRTEKRAVETDTKPKKHIHTKKYNRFDLFDPKPVEEKDPFLNSISRKITLLTLRVSHIENRLADYETQAKIIDEQNYLKDPPFAIPQKEIKLTSSRSSHSSPSQRSYISSSSHITASSLQTKSNIADIDI
ncbi:hypothetical protein TVAG_451070 [Trichomonas vaginalis G3]|uniref:Uncharacterized protein n=1 Tax=Trichomonas vaginalis (strain ATCC PRA-98 / G3) TaxID=412133 RepID=A2EYR0_TRIV3|nr:hypothetical protein TVAGG3_0866070 [Trichomonas vaginalis G3]EAY02207.1 hypothetical protein TVAG_451070 [Trichomonas vaginalis G3]KAI5501034.1 hypothetical protein TVAGG3_0866070 [Trichomonas vaginalis G3]|eukprot:XP_001314545.1 hypothetical protein [Trichomonas vaginalis G3]